MTGVGIDRMRRALARFVDLETARGLEIGPLDRPVLDKSRHRVEYLDLDTADAARTRLENDPKRSPEAVVEVDYPLRGETMSAVVPNQAFDYIFASHVFEHFPDVIGWLQDAAKVLRPGGRVLLFVPDRRFMFDLARPCTTLGQLIENHLVPRLGSRNPWSLRLEDAPCVGPVEWPGHAAIPPAHEAAYRARESTHAAERAAA